MEPAPLREPADLDQPILPKLHPFTIPNLFSFFTVLLDTVPREGLFGCGSSFWIRSSEKSASDREKATNQLKNPRLAIALTPVSQVTLLKSLSQV